MENSLRTSWIHVTFCCLPQASSGFPCITCFLCVIWIYLEILRISFLFFSLQSFFFFFFKFSFLSFMSTEVLINRYVLKPAPGSGWLLCDVLRRGDTRGRQGRRLGCGVVKTSPLGSVSCNCDWQRRWFCLCVCKTQVSFPFPLHRNILFKTAVNVWIFMQLK